MATVCGGSAIETPLPTVSIAPDSEASKKTPKESLDYGDFSLEALNEQQTRLYLDLLRLQAPTQADVKSLDNLIVAHLERIPFQGIDTFFGHQSELAASNVFHNVVEQGRGGNCFELNSLFARLLMSLGYRVRVRCARVRWGLPEDAPIAPVDHMVLCVDFGDGKKEDPEKQFLVDVGFYGPCPRRALPLRGDAFPYRIRTLDEDWAKPMEVSIWFSEEEGGKKGGHWLPLYQVFAYSHEWPDFMDKSWYYAKYPGLILQEVLALSRYDGDSWLTLRNGKFTRRRCTSQELGSVVERRSVADEPSLSAFLQREFELRMDLKWDLEKLRRHFKSCHN
ncbi:arylamine N-acetyltransferase-like [Haemaphysalis longicornis]